MRVFMDSEKPEAWPEIKNWFFILKAKQEQSLELMVDEIKKAGTALSIALAWQWE